MRVARILLGIVLVTVAVLAFLGGGGMWIAMQHESGDGGFGGRVAGLSSPGGVPAKQSFWTASGLSASARAAQRATPAAATSTTSADEAATAWAAPTPAASARVPVPPASRVGSRNSGPQRGAPRRTVPPVFADPLMRPHSLKTAMLLDDEASARREPTRTNESGTYRAFGTPPQVTPAFLRTSAASDDKK